jgi:hypothetical protein
LGYPNENEVKILNSKLAPFVEQPEDVPDLRDIIPRLDDDAFSLLSVS